MIARLRAAGRLHQGTVTSSAETGTAIYARSNELNLIVKARTVVRGQMTSQTRPEEGGHRRLSMTRVKLFLAPLTPPGAVAVARSWRGGHSRCTGPGDPT